jgi:hypothetical protein
MGLQPLKLAPEFADLCTWLIQQGIHKLEDISSWDMDGNWLTWAIPHIPNIMLSQYNPLVVAISWMASVHLHSRDKWGCGHNGAYTTS